MAATTLPRSDSGSRRCHACGSIIAGSRRASNSSTGSRNSGSRRSLDRVSSLNRSSLNRSTAYAVRGANQPDLNFNGLMATIALMRIGDAEYRDTVEIFLSSRYQYMGALYRQYKENQLITKEQWVNYWSQLTDKDAAISAEVAGKIFDSCDFLAKGKTGITPAQLNNLQKTLPRVYRTVTASGAGRQLGRYSWYKNGQEHRDLRRESQLLTPQKYEELIARLRADNESLREKVQSMEEEYGVMATARKSGPSGCECPCPIHHQH